MKSLLMATLMGGAANAGGTGASAPWDVRAQSEGVSLQARVLRDRVRFCIDAPRNMKVSAQYGIEFKAPADERMLWADALPKVITGPGWYFALPVEIDLTSAGGAHERRVQLELGACSAATQTCSKVAFDLVLPPFRDDGRASEECAGRALPY